MKIVSFNVNGLRARLHQLHKIITQFHPDIIGLQETKVHDDYFPIEKIHQYGYHSYYYGQKSHYGVALLSRKKLLNIKKGFFNQNEQHITQKRIIIADIDTPLGLVTIINGYFPQGDNINHPKFINKKNFYKDFQNFIKNNYHATNSLLLVIGDMNISPTNLDIGIDEKQQNLWIKKGKCSFLEEERNWINQLIHWGLIDIFRYFYPKNNYRCYSWFDYRSNNFEKNIGLRIDLLLATQPLIVKCKNIDIKYEIRAMHKPSDHAPILATFDI